MKFSYFYVGILDSIKSGVGLESIDLSNINMRPHEIFNAFSNHYNFPFDKLKKIDLSNTVLMDDDIPSFLPQCSQLVSLRMNGCAYGISDDGAEAISKSCEHLQVIDLGYSTRISGYGIQLIADHCKQLKEIVLSKCFGVTGDDILGLLEKIPLVEKLHLDCLTLVENSLEGIDTKCPELRDLSLHKTKG